MTPATRQDEGDSGRCATCGGKAVYRKRYVVPGRNAGFGDALPEPIRAQAPQAGWLCQEGDCEHFKQDRVAQD